MTLIESIQHKMQFLTPEQLEKVEALVSALQDEDLRHAMLKMAEPSFAAVWDDPENDVYDAL